MKAINVRTALIVTRVLIIALGCLWVMSAISSKDPNGPVELLVDLNLVTGTICVVAILGFGIYHFAQKLATQPKRAMGALIGFVVFILLKFV